VTDSVITKINSFLLLKANNIKVKDLGSLLVMLSLSSYKQLPNPRDGKLTVFLFYPSSVSLFS